MVVRPPCLLPGLGLALISEQPASQAADVQTARDLARTSAVAEGEAERMERVLALARLKHVLGPQNA